MWAVGAQGVVGAGPHWVRGWPDERGLQYGYSTARETRAGEAPVGTKRDGAARLGGRADHLPQGGDPKWVVVF
jgi:hypothetical protein